MQDRQKKAEITVRSIIIVVVLILTVYPIYWLTICSFKPIYTVFSGFPGIPVNLSFRNYIMLFKEGAYVRYLINSLIVAGATTFITIIVALFGAYSLVRLKFPGADNLALMILFTYMVPKILLLIPLYIWMFNLGLLNTYVALITVHLTMGLPFSLWILRGFLVALPKELEEAALIDGASHIGALFKIIFPLCAPGVIAAAMFCFITSWNDYVYGLLLVNREEMRTLSVGLSYLYLEGEEEVYYGLLMAGSVVAYLPVFLIFVFAQKYIVRGLVLGGTKG